MTEYFKVKAIPKLHNNDLDTGYIKVSNIGWAWTTTVEASQAHIFSQELFADLVESAHGVCLEYYDLKFETIVNITELVRM